MKLLSIGCRRFSPIILIILLCFENTFAQHQGQMVIVPNDPRVTPAFLCHGVLLNPMLWGITELDTGSTPITIDSFKFRATKGFDLSGQYSYSYVVNPCGPPTYAQTFTKAFRYQPSSVEDDTLWYTVFYGRDSSTQFFPYVCRESPPFGLRGLTQITEQIYRIPGRDMVWSDDAIYQVRTDSLLDEKSPPIPYFPSTTPQPHTWHGFGNENVVFLACDQTVIDSIVGEGDFSEIQFTNMPQFPFTVGPDDSLVLTYDFIPQIIGTHCRPLIFYIHGGGQLVWMFEYTVLPESSVSSSVISKVEIYPNPTNGSVSLHAMPSNTRQIQVLNTLGAVVLSEGSLCGGDQTLDLGSLPAGMYIVRVETAGGVQSQVVVKE